ncbi:MAG: LptF/LptG family permease [Planctomycetales bacterium]|nr:LptF/LptG family permease [Planctomycetales bacterium]
MTLIDRYVLRLFVKVLLVCFFSIAGLFIVVDAFSNVDEFVACAKQSGGAGAVLWNFYSARMLSLFNFSSGLLVLVAGMFTITWLHRTNEFTALMAAGLPKFRIVAPLLIAATIVSLLNAASRELLIPRFRDELSRGWRELAGEYQEPVSPKYDNETNVWFDGKHVDDQRREIIEPTLMLPFAIRGVGKQLTAAVATYRPPAADQPEGYLLTGVNQAALREEPSLRLGERVVVYSPKDTPWLQPDQAFIASHLTYTHLTADKAWRQWSSSRQLIGALQNPSVDFGRNVRVAVHSRFVKPLLDVTLLFLGLPLVLSARKRSVFAAAGICFLLVSAFYVVVLCCQMLGSNWLISPALAAWCPVMIFTPVAYANSIALWQ